MVLGDSKVIREGDAISKFTVSLSFSLAWKSKKTVESISLLAFSISGKLIVEAGDLLGSELDLLEGVILELSFSGIRVIFWWDHSRRNIVQLLGFL